MAKVIFKVGQSFIDKFGRVCFGKKGEEHDVPDDFLNLIRGKYEVHADDEESEEENEEETQEESEEENEEGDVTPENAKPTGNMNKDELLKLVSELDTSHSAEELNAMTKKELIQLINS